MLAAPSPSSSPPFRVPPILFVLRTRLQPLSVFLTSTSVGPLHIRGVQCSNRAAAEQRQRTVHVFTQNLDRSSHACFAGGRHPIGVRAADQHGLGPQAQGLYDIAASPHASIHQHFGLLADRCYHLGQRVKTSHAAV